MSKLERDTWNPWLKSLYFDLYFCIHYETKYKLSYLHKTIQNHEKPKTNRSEEDGHALNLQKIAAR